jgi:hypothetical protein
VGKQACPALVTVHVQPVQVRHGTKQTEPLLQSTAKGSPQAEPPNWQQAAAGRATAAAITAATRNARLTRRNLGRRRLRGQAAD